MSKSIPPASQGRVWRRIWAPLLAGLLVAFCVAAVFWLLPRELPALGQRSLGLAFAVLMTTAFFLASRPRESAAVLAHRARLAQHSDFGKALYAAQAPRRRTVPLPLVGRVSLRSLGGVGVFCIAAAWWLTPWTPIRVKKPVIEDISIPLSEAIVAPLLVLPNSHIAVLQTPLPPNSAVSLAGAIPDSAGAYQLALKETAYGHFDRARLLLDGARQAPGADPARIELAEAQIAMFSYRFADAAHCYDHLLLGKPDDPLLWCQLAVAHMQAGEFAQAEPAVARAAALLGKNPPPSVAAAACLHLQALLQLNSDSDFDKAEIIAHDSGEIWKQALGENHPGLAASVNNLAALYLLHGDYPGAKGLLGGACDIWSKSPHGSDPCLAAGRDNLGALYMTTGEDDQAEQSLDEAAAIFCQTLPKDHPNLALHLAAGAWLKRIRGRFADAQADAEQALVLVEKTLGGEHPDVAAILDVLTAVATDQGRYAQAYAYGSRANGLIKRLWGPEHPYLAVNLCELAMVHVAQGRYDEAEDLCRQALRIVRRTFGPKHCWVAMVQYTRGRLEIARGAPRDARQYLKDALDIWQPALGEEHPQVVSLLGDLASLDNSPSTLAGGVARAKRAVELAQQCYGGEHPEVARLLCILAVLQGRQGRQEDYAAAIAALKRALDIREKMLPANHPDLAVTLETYAAMLRAMNPPQSELAHEMEARAKAVRAKHAEEDQVK